MCAPVILKNENYKTARTHIRPAVPKFSIQKCQRFHHYYYQKRMRELHQNHQAVEGRDIKIIPKSIYKKAGVRRCREQSKPHHFEATTTRPPEEALKSSHVRVGRQEQKEHRALHV